MSIAALFNDGLGYVGGAAVVITIASIISAYNQYRSRKHLEEIKALLEED